LNPHAKISDPPAAIKKRKGVRVPMYLCISTVFDFNSQNFAPLMKFDKYSPVTNTYKVKRPSPSGQ